ncbi:hydroxyacid dehydrogenase [Parahaliea maris]|uniref:Hydroxyacid dehydrogenase n=1 Tax=Parahaliea maris TaxID=2716870 RepID=A0A5C8ZP20_9GAMM|nr:NAD(P)-dependent oxidoreductase [Parahaliea maris]TXS89514.1 hydroxyacid dehydrogenase [Parahaliea maris]
MIRVLFQYDTGPQLRRELDALREQGIEVISHPESAAPPGPELLESIQAIWHVLQPVTSDMIAAAPQLALVQKIGVGVNTIDLDAARARDVAVCNMPGTNSQAVAEMTLLLMLSALRQQVRMDRACRSGAWSLPSQQLEGFGELAGSVVGLVGFGEVPRRLAPVLQALGAQVIYSARSPRDVPWPCVELEELLARADVVSLHLPLTPDTGHLLDSRRIGLMKPGAILVNTARGGLVDEGALLSALQAGHLAGAGLDVFAEEPVAADHPLLALDNVVVAPHLAWLTRETFSRSISLAARNTLAAVRGGELAFRVA